MDIDSESMGLSLPLSAVNAEPTDRKKAAFAEVHRLKEESPGYSDAGIAKLTGLCPATVSLYLSQEQPKGNIRHNYVDFWDYLPVINDCQKKGLWMNEIHEALLEAMKKDDKKEVCSLSSVRRFMSAAYPKYTHKFAGLIGKAKLPDGEVNPLILTAMQILNSKKLKYFLSSRRYGNVFVPDKVEEVVEGGSGEKPKKRGAKAKGQWELTDSRKMFVATCELSPTLAELAHINYAMSDTLAGKHDTSLDKWSEKVEKAYFEHTIKFLKTLDKYKNHVQVGIDTGRTNSPCEGVNCLY